MKRSESLGQNPQDDRTHHQSNINRNFLHCSKALNAKEIGECSLLTRMLPRTFSKIKRYRQSSTLLRGKHLQTSSSLFNTFRVLTSSALFCSVVFSNAVNGALVSKEPIASTGETPQAKPAEQVLTAMHATIPDVDYTDSVPFTEDGLASDLGYRKSWPRTLTNNSTTPSIVGIFNTNNIVDDELAKHSVRVVTTYSNVTITDDAATGASVSLNTSTMNAELTNHTTPVTRTARFNSGDAASVAQVQVTMSDDISPTVADIVVTPRTLGVNEGDTGIYEIKLAEVPTGTVTITPVSGDTSIATVSDALEFTTETWDMSQEVTVTGVQDDDFQNHRITITHTIMGGGYDNVSDRPVSVTVTDDDSPGIEIDPTTLTIDENDTETYSVKLTAQPTDSVTVRPRSDNTSIATVSGELTFTTGSWSDAQMVTVTGTQDDDFQDDSAMITHTIRGGGYNGVPDQPVTVMVTDDDSPTIEIDPTTLTIDEGKRDTYSVKLAVEPTGNVTITPVSSDTNIATVSGPIVFTRSNWNRDKTVTVTGVQDDNRADDNTMINHTIVGGGYDDASDQPVSVMVTDDDIPTLIVEPTTLRIKEGRSATYNMRLSVEPTGSVTVTPASDDEDVATVSGALVFTTRTWSAFQTVRVTGVEDDSDLQDGSITVTHTIEGGGYDDAVDRSVSVTVIDNDSPEILVDPRELEVQEGTSGTYSVSLVAQPTGSVTVTPASGNENTATVSGPMVFTTVDWEMPQMVTVTGVVDNDSDNDVVRITHTISGGGYDSAPDQPVEVTIVEDDTPRIVVDPQELTVDEGGSETYTVRLAVEPTGTVTITPASDDEDVATVSGAVRFARNNWSVPQSVRVTGAQDDDHDHGDATITHTIIGGGYDDALDQSVSVTVNDDDAPGILVNPTRLTVDEGSAASYVVRLTTQPTNTVTVRPVSSNTSVVTVSDALTFTTTNWSTAKTVTVRAVQDENSQDSDETITHTITGGNYDGVRDRPVSVTVRDDDVPGIVVNPRTLTIDGGDTATYSVRLTTRPTGPVTITPRSQDNNIATVSGALIFTRQDWSTTQTVTVAGVQNDGFEDQNTTISHTINGGGYNNVPDRTVRVTVVSDESPEIVVEPTALTIDEGDTAIYSVHLTARPTGSVTITPRSDNTNVATVSGALVFTRQDWSTAQMVMVTSSQDDDFQDGSAMITHTIRGGGYDGVPDQPVSVTVLDDESPSIVVNPRTLSINEGDSGTYSVSLATQPSGSVTVRPVSSDTTTATVSGALTFTTGNWSMPQMVTVTSSQDDDAESSNITISHDISGGGFDQATDRPVSVTVIDDDEADVILGTPTPNPVAEGGTFSYSVVLSAAPSDTVTITQVSSSTAIDELPNSPITFNANNWSTPQNFNVSTIDDANAVDEEIIISHTVTGGNFNAVEVEDVVVTVEDGDTAAVIYDEDLFPDFQLDIAEGGAASYTLTLATEPTANVIIIPKSSDATVALVSEALVFTPTDWNTPKPITAWGIHDDDSTDGMTTITHTVTGGDYGDVTMDDLPVLVTDDDNRGVNVTPTTLTLDEASDTTYLVNLTTKPIDNVTITPTSDSPALTVSGPLTFTPQNWETHQRVTVTANADTNLVSEVVDIEHLVVGGDYGSVIAPVVTVTINDDDTPSVTLSHNTLTVYEGDETTYSVRLNFEPSDSVVFTAMSGDESTLSVSAEPLTFTRENWGNDQIITVTAAEDDNAVSEEVTISHSITGGGYDAVAVPNITVTVTDTSTPAAPIGLEAEAGNGQVTLSWTNPDDGTIMTYHVLVNGGTWTPIPNSDASTTSHIITDLSNGVEYTFAIRAVNPAGIGDVSGTVSAIPAVHTMNLMGEGGNEVVILTWDNPNDASITKYQIRVQINTSGLWSDIPSSDSSTTSYIVTNLENGTEYSFTVRTVHGKHAGIPSNPVSVIPAVSKQILLSNTLLPQVNKAALTGVMDALSKRMQGADLVDTWPSGLPLIPRLSGNVESTNLYQLLDGMTLSIPVNFQSQDAPETMIWITGEYKDLSIDVDGLATDGAVSAFRVGSDIQIGIWRIGLMLSSLKNIFDYKEGEAHTGSFESPMMGINPYFGWRGREGGANAWATAGYYKGYTTIKDSVTATQENNIEMLMTAAGGSLQLLGSNSAGPKFWINGDWANGSIETKVNDTSDGITVESQLFRVMLEAQYSFQLDSGGSFTPSVEFGTLYDSTSDASSEIVAGGAVRFVTVDKKTIVDIWGHVLTKSDVDVKEWSAGGFAQFNPEPDDLGLLLNLETIWSRPNNDTYAPNHGYQSMNNWSGYPKTQQLMPTRKLTNSLGNESWLRMQASYSFPAKVHLGILRPFTTMSFGNQGSRNYSAGLSFLRGDTLKLLFEAITRNSTQPASTDHAVMLHGQLSL